MTEDQDIIEHDTLRVGEDGYATGSVFAREKAGKMVQGTVSSYEYQSRGETKMNHVPHIIVTDTEGKILAEPTARDSENAERAIKNVKGAVKHVYEHLSEFTD